VETPRQSLEEFIKLFTNIDDIKKFKKGENTPFLISIYCIYFSPFVIGIDYKADAKGAIEDVI
jgi:hypothetical protein